MKLIHQKIKEISFLLAGALIGIISISFQGQISSHLLAIGIIIVFLMLIGVGIIDGIIFVRIFFIRKINNFRRKICLYAPYEIDSETSSWIDVSQRQLLNLIIKNKINFAIIKKESSIFKYPVVVNPYGGVYPEKNASTLESLNFLFDYVNKGGIYINIADIPFYYAFDQYHKRMINTTPLAGDFSQVRSFLQTILTKKLHCFVFGLTSGEDFDNNITRIISLAKNSRNLFNKSIKIDETETLYSPVLTIPYGKGYFVFSTIQITKENFEELLQNLILDLKNLMSEHYKAQPPLTPSTIPNL